MENLHFNGVFIHLTLLVLLLIGYIGNTFCQQAVFEGNLTITVSGESTDSNTISEYLLTDKDGVIQMKSAIPQFSNVKPGVFDLYMLVYGLGTAITGNNLGNNIQEISGACYDLSPKFPMIVYAQSNDCNLEVQLSPSIYYDNDTPLNTTDDFFTFKATIKGESEWGWTTGLQEGLFNTEVTFGPYPVDSSGARIIVKSKDNPKCFSTISANMSACLYLQTCTCCKIEK